MDPALLAPYANQPRMYMNPAKLAELEASIASQGVSETVVITPVCKAPWAEFHPGDEDLPFLIVSGHRRRESALAGSVAAVPVQIRIYKDKAAFEEDAETLNDHRENLSEVEEGFRYRRKIENGDRITHLVARTGHPYQWIQGRIALTYLCPAIQAKVGPNLKPRERLAIGFASALGSVALTTKFEFDHSVDIESKLAELGKKGPISEDLPDDDKRFALQHAYLTYCEKRGWKGVVSAKYVKTGEKPESNGTGRAGHGANGKFVGVAKKPSGLRLQLIEWIRYLNETNFLDMSETEISRALTNAVAQDIESMADRIELVATVLRQVADKKQRYSELALAGAQKRLEQRVLAD